MLQQFKIMQEKKYRYINKIGNKRITGFKKIFLGSAAPDIATYIYSVFNC
jgi:hypothetical protein